MLCAISKNAHKKSEAVVEANGGYIEEIFFFSIIRVIKTFSIEKILYLITHGLVTASRKGLDRY